MSIDVTVLLDAIRADLHEYNPLIFRNNDLLTWLNDGIQGVASETHGVAQDWLSRRMLSTDSTEIIQSESYSPASLQITAGVSLYTLPPNVIQIRTLEPATQTYRDAGVYFLPRPHNHPEFLRQARLSYSQSPQRFYYSAVGLRSLRIAPTPPEGATAMDVEMWYVALPSRLQIGDSFTEMPIQAIKAVKAYAVWCALKSINSPDSDAKYAVYEMAIKEANVMLTPRNTNDPQFVEGAYAGEDYTGTTSY